MGSSSRERNERACECCFVSASTLFRVRSDANQPWKFLCQACQQTLKSTSSTYLYGGTWKKKKRN
ncbi:hypothetical protein KJ365_06810 [Glaciecola sp. XM2]|uniref:hypothetical protein n=1 Tax=Glaciecola sp. XM2 TaxID=1914931 RepID=UPI001BDE8F0D|nr:hypothetical protein [Glaciecola sp. XM2]MBT1450589.1 hypothetical protein [Glaciecola sp. XM2]